MVEEVAARIPVGRLEFQGRVVGIVVEVPLPLRLPVVVMVAMVAILAVVVVVEVIIIRLMAAVVVAAVMAVGRVMQI
jgi:hypothetical protein